MESDDQISAIHNVLLDIKTSQGEVAAGQKHLCNKLDGLAVTTAEQTRLISDNASKLEIYRVKYNLSTKQINGHIASLYENQQNEYHILHGDDATSKRGLIEKVKANEKTLNIVFKTSIVLVSGLFYFVVRNTTSVYTWFKKIIGN